jgi:triacylglycerol lipase
MDAHSSPPTRYPLLLVHGVGLTHRRHFWGRIPGALAAQGYDVHLAQTDGWGTAAHNAAALKVQVEHIIAHSGCERVNIIAHSKGGIDARYLATSLGAAPQIASITTLSTPHAGARTMTFLLRWFWWALKVIAPAFNLLMRLLKEASSDFYGVCAELGTTAMERFNAQNPPAPEVYYQSYASAVTTPLSDIAFSPLNAFVRLFDGDNDGLVSPASACYGAFKGTIFSATQSGISHRDMIDLRRRPFRGRVVRPTGVTDIVDWHSALVADLQQRGF